MLIKDSFFLRKKTFLILDIILFSLFLIFAIRFSLGQKKQNTDITLLNPKYLPFVEKVSFINQNSKDLILQKEEKSYLLKKGELVAPCDSESYKKLLDVFSKAHRSTVISSSKEQAKKLGFNSENQLDLVFSSKEKDFVQLEIIHSKEKSDRLYLRAKDSEKVYIIDSQEMYYLADADFQSWADPLVFPLESLGLSGKIQSNNEFLAKARRGPVLESVYTPENEVLKTIDVFIGGGARAKISFYPVNFNDEDFYLAVPSFYSDLADGNKLLPLNYSFTISSWTYERIIEENK